MNTEDNEDYTELYAHMLRRLDNVGETLLEARSKIKNVQAKTEELIEDLDETTEPVRPKLLEVRQRVAVNVETIDDLSSRYAPGKELAEFNKATESLRQDEPFNQIVNQEDQ